MRNFGVGVVGAVKFEARIKELVENLPDLTVLVEPLLIVRWVFEQLGILHRRVLAIVRDDDVPAPDVGPGGRADLSRPVDVPARFRNSKAVGAVFGLTPSNRLEKRTYLAHRNSFKGEVALGRMSGDAG